MKIDEGCINYNAVRLIDELTESIYEYPQENDVFYKMTLAEIRGVLNLASELKTVLKA